MRPELFTIRRTGSGALSTMARPYGGQWLEAAMSGLAEAGVGVLVSLLSEAEIAELELAGEAEAARAAGMEFYHLPTPDRTVPDQAASLGLAQTLRTLLELGASVAVHCRYGIGRSSTLAAMVMVVEGTDPEQAWALISAARGRTVPDTLAQREAVQRIAEQLAGTAPAGEFRGDQQTLAAGLVQDCPDPADA